MAGTTVDYNGVTIRNCETVSFKQSVRYDESNTDVVFSLFRMRWRGFVHGQYGSFSGVDTGRGGNNAVDPCVQIRAMLMQPRQTLSVQLGTYTLMYVSGQNLNNPGAGIAQIDVNNGPKPIDLDIVHVAGFRTITVEWEVEVAIVTCDGARHGDPSAMAGVINTPEVLSNRWTTQETRDENFYATLEISGALKVRRVTQGPDLFRYLMVPPLLPEFQRKSCVFIADPDGLGMHYRITDKQNYAAPPGNATEWSGEYVIDVTQGALVMSTVRISLTGPPHGSRHDLLIAAMQVVEARLGNLRLQPVPLSPKGSKPARSVIVRSANIRENLRDNKIDVEVRAQEQPDDTATLSAIMAMPLAAIGQMFNEGQNPIQGYDATLWPLPELYASAVGPLAILLADPCWRRIPSLQGTQYPSEPSLNTDAKSTRGDIAGNHQGGDTTAISSQSAQVLSDYPAPISSQHQQHAYTYVEIENHYVTQTGYVMLPLAQTDQGPKDDTAAFVRCHGPITRRILRMRAERAYDWPQYPQPDETRTDLNGINETLLNYTVVPVTPKLLADSKNFLYAGEIQLEYGLSRSPTLQELFTAGADPITNTQASDNAMPGSALTNPAIQGGSSTSSGDNSAGNQI